MIASIGIVIPTYQAAHHLSHCLLKLINSSLKPRILVIDSSSTDGSAEIAKKMGAEVIVIPKQEFNHGLTREMGRKYLNTSILVVLTQDVYAQSEKMLENLIAPLLDGRAAASYARQIPHEGAGILAAFPRYFNYPAESHVRKIDEIDRYGSYMFFFSNACAAYFNKALDEIGGFSSVQFGEDTLAAAKLLHHGYSIAYVADAVVHHSHDYTLEQEFKRHYQMAKARYEFRDWIVSGGGDHKRGSQYVLALLKVLKKEKPQLIPYALVQSFVKLLGYQCGKINSKYKK